MKRQAPQAYLREAETFLLRIAQGMTVAEACGGERRTNVYLWLRRYPDFRERYIRALHLRNVTLARQYAANPTPELKRRRWDARKGAAKTLSTLNRALNPQMNNEEPQRAQA